LEDEENLRPAILMHLTSIAEQFDKLSKDAEFEILSKFDKADLKGSYDIRNYIVHDYENNDLYYQPCMIAHLDLLAHLLQKT
jgi:uncharacterized protein with HEPN domain